ncbi:MAG: glycosyltransferase family 39 protein [candidate division NC10 bacterium]|nr:glycosyltransferase family 39 protein [candidate division NC10 bacterium]
MPLVRRRVLGGVWLLVTVPVGLWVFRGLTPPAPAMRVQIEEPFNHGIASGAARLTVGGFRSTPKGFALEPQGQGEIEYRVRTAQPLTRWSAITLQWYGGEAGIQSTVDLLDPGGPQRLLQNRSLAGTRLPLPESVAGGTEIALRFSARNPTGEMRLVLDKLVLQSWDGPPPSFPAAGWVGAIFLAVALGLAGLTAHPKRAALVGLLLTLALVLRYANVSRVAMAPLDPDAQGYRAYAQALTWTGPQGFYSAGFGEREPLYPAIVKLALWLFGDADLSLRLLSAILSVGVVSLGYRLGRALLGTTWGLGAGLFLSVSVPAINESGRGLRVELETLLLTGAAWLLLGTQGSLPWHRAILAGVVGGGLLLTRFPYAPALLIVFAVSAWWHRDLGRRLWRPLLVAVAIAAVLVLPHRLAMAARDGDAGYDVHRTLRWIANQEFQGQPGFPSPGAVIRDPYVGPRITLGQYYFGLHSAWEVAWRSLRGLGRAVLNLSPVGYVEEVRAVVGLGLGWVDLLVAGLGVIGLGALAVRRETRWIPVVLVLGLVHVAFVYDLDLPDYRFRMILQVMPLFAVAAAAGSRWVLGRMVVMLPASRQYCSHEVQEWHQRSSKSPQPPFTKGGRGGISPG